MKPTLKEAVALLNKCLGLLKIKDRISLDMDPGKGMDLCGDASCSYGRMLLKEEKNDYKMCDEMCKTNDAEQVVREYFTEKWIEDENRKKQITPTAQQTPKATTSSSSAQAGAYAYTSSGQSKLLFTAPKTDITYVPYQQPIPIPSAPAMDDDSCPPPAFNPEIFPSYATNQPKILFTAPKAVAVQPKVEIFDETNLLEWVHEINKIPGLKKKLNLDMSQPEAAPILGLAGDYAVQLSDSDDSDSDEEVSHIMDVTDSLSDYFIAKSKGVARISPAARKAVLAY